MTRMTIDYGIDLGTTNSEVALLKGNQVEVFKNNEGFEFTPSAVWIDAKERMFVGRQAKQRLEDDPDNAICEFKLQMGTSEKKTFARSGKCMKPEELSATVLKELCATVKQRTGEEIEAAVITVPAAFDLPQNDATNRAARLAGLKQSPLLQEPIAAALAYSFQSGSDKVFWLVYDFGGGTFDAAVIQVRDDEIQVVNHEGDNHLGGKLIDWAIVEKLLIPALTREHPLTDFRRGNAKWRSAIAKLKLQAEEAKIRVSGADSTDIIIDFLCQDDRDEPVRFEYELSKRDVERLAEPLILRSINICKKTLAEKRLEAGSVERVILVGGPTSMPYLRDRLSDAREGLGIPLEFGVDPLTVVACGAAIFAGNQRRKVGPPPPPAAGQFSMELDYKPMGPDVEPLVGGKVHAAQVKDFSGFTIEFVNTSLRPPWRSGKLGLGPEGTFTATLWAEKGAPNAFAIELRDPTGQSLPTDPANFTYVVSIVITDQPLTHSVGVGTADNEMYTFFEKGTPLPARRREVFKTAFEVQQGKEGNVIRVPALEGENKRADRNRRIGTLEAKAYQVKRTVPAGSDIEVTMDIDDSRLIRVKAYIPMLDEEFEHIIKFGEYGKVDAAEIRKDLEAERKRLDAIRQKTEETHDPTARTLLDRIDQERMLHEVEESLAAAAADPDAGQKAMHRLGDLRKALDEVEDAVQWPALKAEAKQLIASSQMVVTEYGDSSDKRSLENHEAEIKKAVQTHDADLVRKATDELRVFVVHILDRKGIMPMIFFQQLSNSKGEMRDRALAEQLIAQGQRAMNTNDIDGLRLVNRQLADLLPTPPASPDIDSILTRRS